MTLATLKKVNDAIKAKDLELVKHPDYFYFMGLTDEAMDHIPTSVYVRRISDLTLEEWIAHTNLETDQ